MDTLVALLAALVGAFGALGAVWLQTWNQSRSSETDARESAYIDLLVSSLALARRARSLIAVGGN
jgi:Flp pilus assembly protein CpaB